MVSDRFMVSLTRSLSVACPDTFSKAFIGTSDESPGVPSGL